MNGSPIVFLSPLYLFRSVQSHTSFNKSQSITLPHSKGFVKTHQIKLSKFYFAVSQKLFSLSQTVLPYNDQNAPDTNMSVCCFQNSFKFKILISLCPTEFKDWLTSAKAEK